MARSSSAVVRGRWLALAGAACLLLSACAGHSDKTRDARTALDAGRPRAALELYNEQLDVDDAKQTPEDIEGDRILFVLDRATILQALGEYALSSRDLQLADKQVEVLDLSRGTLDDIGKYMFSDDSGPYAAAPYEKLMVNTLNMVNYLARGDLSGARVEARRLTTLQKYIATEEGQASSLVGPGSYLAGFIFEKSREPGEALRYYDEALQYGEYRTLTEAVQRLGKLDAYRTPRLTKVIEAPDETQPENEAQTGDVLLIVSYGRVPAKVANRVPIGLALTLASGFISPYDHARANRLALQGLVTWVNYPSLGKPRGEWDLPSANAAGRAVPLEGMLAVDIEAARAWKKHEGKVIASAITRTITRIIAGEATRRATGGGVVGLLVGLGTQATLTATDTPDTRSWSTLPARIAFGRLRLPAGRHTIDLWARGGSRRQTIDVKPGGWAVVNLTVLR